MSIDVSNWWAAIHGDRTSRGDKRLALENKMGLKVSNRGLPIPIRRRG